MTMTDLSFVSSTSTFVLSFSHMEGYSKLHTTSKHGNAISQTCLKYFFFTNTVIIIFDTATESHKPETITGQYTHKA
jgi:hypothetical protein